MTPPPPAGRHDPLNAFRAACGSCQAPILWADTTAGERMPVDEQPVPDGNVLLHITDDSPKPKLIAGVLTRGQAGGARDRQERLYRSHFSSCPNASGHRRSRSKTRRWRRT
jgi:hypothetical protein